MKHFVDLIEGPRVRMLVVQAVDEPGIVVGPNTLPSLHLWIDGFSCCYQLMASAGVFICIIPFLNHMILFSDSPLTSLPSFLYNSLTTQLCIFLFLLYLVMFISHSSDVVPHSSATSEVSYFIYNDTPSYIVLTMYM